MRWTRTLIPTTRETPADAQIISHQLMLRAGLIRQLTAGVYDLLPLGLRALHKAQAIIRHEMEGIGCAELLLPALQPLDLWKKTGRDQSYGENLLTLTDRHGRRAVLAPTHEEAITELIAATVSSYRQLPLAFYQFQTKFRDEYRPRFGLLRVREFLMKDAYSIHASRASLDEWYQAFRAAYERIFTRCGIPHAIVEAESGPVGGSASHEFMALCDAGEDLILSSDKGNYAANVERCAIGRREANLGGAPTAELERIHTPGLHTVDEVARVLNVPTRQILKTLLYIATPKPDAAYAPRWIVAVVRGDHNLNEGKLRRTCQERFNVADITLTDTPELRQRFAIGFVGPDIAMREFFAVLVIDPDAAQDEPWVAGGNEIDYHVRGFNWFRDAGDRLADPAKTLVADIRDAIDGDPSPRDDGGTLRAARAIEIGHIFQLGTRYASALDARFVNETGQREEVVMGCYGIGVGRLLVAAIEASHDDAGIIWPAALAPYSVCITPVRYEGETRTAADRLYAELTAAGIDAILDDRDARPGAKFADADLIGFPLRITLGDRVLKEGKYEMKRRRDRTSTLIEAANATDTIRAALNQC